MQEVFKVSSVAQLKAMLKAWSLLYGKSGKQVQAEIFGWLNVHHRDGRVDTAFCSSDYKPVLAIGGKTYTTVIDCKPTKCNFNHVDEVYHPRVRFQLVDKVATVKDFQ